MKPALKCIDYEKNELSIIQCNVPPQNGINDCGLFALAYHIAICHGFNPSQMLFDQSVMREHYNSFFNTAESNYNCMNTIQNFPYICQFSQPKLQSYKHVLNIMD